MRETSRQVPIPACDPFFGAEGPLASLWADADSGRPVPQTLAVDEAAAKR
jgi:hypothetical protein